MKRIFMTLMAAVFVGGIAEAGWEASDYSAYEAAKKAGNEADTAGDLAKAAAEFKTAAELAGKAGAAKAQAWRLNNAAYAMIRDFKAKTGYDAAVSKLEGMQPSAEKIAEIEKVSESFKSNMALLDEAGGLLEQAKGLGIDEAGQVIDSNTQFISWVKSFPAEEAPAAEEAPEAPAENPAQ